MAEEFTDFEEVFMRVESAKKMVGSATVSMDPDSLSNATTAVEEARYQLEKMKAAATDLDEAFLRSQEQMLTQCEHQLQEAKQ
ncbi:DUF2564 family protein [Bacillus sp. 165]|uniref:DUF2564 family protein n=1 Tax=Bacillus sp. 165 TaxID=1529117 RepID=UPI001AD9ED5F|nr:DUF2564 family protein [Bacillus sp. 165]MBO9128178.1 DUF2564 family protein [Bacillus sp. 165]